MSFLEENIINGHGCPGRIQSDGGPPYVSEAIRRFYEQYKITPTVTAPYHTESNGMAERMMRTLKTSVKFIKLQSVDNWRRALKIAVAAYRMVPHCATGYSPFKMLYG